MPYMRRRARAATVHGVRRFCAGRVSIPGLSRASDVGGTAGRARAPAGLGEPVRRRVAVQQCQPVPASAVPVPAPVPVPATPSQRRCEELLRPALARVRPGAAKNSTRTRTRTHARISKRALAAASAHRRSARVDCLSGLRTGARFVARPVPLDRAAIASSAQR